MNIRNFVITIIFCALMQFCYSQHSDSIYISKTTADNNAARYSKVEFRFYYLKTGKEIPVLAMNIDDIRLPVSGIAKLYLHDKTYKVFVKYPMFTDSRTFEIPVDTKYDYVVSIFLSTSSKPVEPYPTDN